MLRLARRGRPDRAVAAGTLGLMLPAELESLAGALSRLGNPVLWKLGSNDLPANVTKESLQLGANIRTASWLPQACLSLYCLSQAAGF